MISVDSKIIRITGLCLLVYIRVLLSTIGKDLKVSSFIVVLEVRDCQRCKTFGTNIFYKMKVQVDYHNLDCVHAYSFSQPISVTSC